MRKFLFALVATTVLTLHGGAAMALGGLNHGGGGHGGGGGGGGPRGAPFPIALLGLPLAAGLFAYVTIKNRKH